MAKKLSSGQSVEKITTGWKLSSRMETSRCLISAHSALSFSHVRRETNKVADLLANLGAEGGGALRIGNMEDFENEDWAHNCSLLGNSCYEKIRQVDKSG